MAGHVSAGCAEEVDFNLRELSIEAAGRSHEPGGPAGYLLSDSAPALAFFPPSPGCLLPAASDSWPVLFGSCSVSVKTTALILKGTGDSLFWICSE